MKKLSSVLLVVALAAGCSINGKPMFGLGAKSPAAASGGAGSPVAVGGADDDNWEGDECQGMVRTAPTCAERDAARAAETKRVALANHLAQLQAAMNDRERAVGAYEQRRCTSTYDEAIAAGFPKTMTITVNGQSGTMEALTQKHCFEVVAQTRANEAAQREAREAPYRAKLKADKLEMALSGHYWTDANGSQPNADKLAAARVWYAPEQLNGFCDSNGGPRYALHRYAFDNGHKLVKQSRAFFCGDPPDSAFK